MFLPNYQISNKPHCKSCHIGYTKFLYKNTECRIYPKISWSNRYFHTQSISYKECYNTKYSSKSRSCTFSPKHNIYCN